jgi:hypothetical protein
MGKHACNWHAHPSPKERIHVEEDQIGIQLESNPRVDNSLRPTRSGYPDGLPKGLYAPPTTYSEEYPNIPKPKVLTDLDLLAARWASVEIWPEKMPGIAADLLESGLDSPSLRRLAGEMHVRRIADVQEIVERMFRELGVELPASEVAARQHTSVQIAREVIAGMRNPWKAAAEFDRMWSYEMWHHKYLCDIAQLLEELDCPTISRRDLPKLTEELIGLFAELAA